MMDLPQMVDFIDWKIHFFDFAILGAIQVDRYGNINTVCVGPHDKPRLRGPGTLLTHDAESLALAEFAGLLPRSALEIDLATVERQFNRLVDVANGRPALTEGLPPRATFAANLLILRELMHHAGRVSVTVAPLVPGNEKPGNPEQLPASPPMEKAP